MICIEDSLKKIGIVPVIKIDNPALATDMATALKGGGIHAAEITFRTATAADAIRTITKNVPTLSVYAGTILNIETAKRAVDAGACAIISPGTNPELVEWCQKNEIPIIPGCATPTEVEACMRLGLTLVKLFPAEVIGGISMLKALSGPYSGMKFMPTGGISIDNVKDYLSLSNVVACGGSWIVPENLLNSGDFAGIQRLARQAAELTKAVRNQF